NSARNLLGSGKYVIRDLELGSWKLSEVIARYSRRNPAGKNLNAWPSVVNHRRPPKVIVVEGGFLGIFEFSPCIQFRDRVGLTSSRLSKFSLSQDRVGFVSTDTGSDQSLPRANWHSTLGSRSRWRTMIENLKELATPDVVYQPWCIHYPQLEPYQSYELKSAYGQADKQRKLQLQELEELRLEAYENSQIYKSMGTRSNSSMRSRTDNGRNGETNLDDLIPSRVSNQVSRPSQIDSIPDRPTLKASSYLEQPN
ncbi:hypothetical protein CR513_57913, partial [Mucuna pruriens]